MHAYMYVRMRINAIACIFGQVVHAMSIGPNALVCSCSPPQPLSARCDDSVLFMNVASLFVEMAQSRRASQHPDNSAEICEVDTEVFLCLKDRRLQCNCWCVN